MRFTHTCEVEFGLYGQTQRRTVLVRALESRYEDEAGFWYDRHLCPGRAIVTTGSGARGRLGYTRQLLLATMQPIRPRNRL